MPCRSTWTRSTASSWRNSRPRWRNSRCGWPTTRRTSKPGASLATTSAAGARRHRGRPSPAPGQQERADALSCGKHAGRPYLVVPRVSSERRDYIPIGFLGPDTLCSDATLIIPDTTLYHFGVLHCAMHIAWVRYVCGRLKSDYRYSAQIVYNNFSWPGSPRRWAPTKPPQRARHRCATPSNRPRAWPAPATAGSAGRRQGTGVAHCAPQAQSAGPT